MLAFTSKQPITDTNYYEPQKIGEIILPFIYDDVIILAYIPCKADTLMPVLLQSTSIELPCAMCDNLDDDISCLSELLRPDSLPMPCLLTKLLIPQILKMIFSSRLIHPFLFFALLLCCSLAKYYRSFLCSDKKLHAKIPALIAE